MNGLYGNNLSYIIYYYNNISIIFYDILLSICIYVFFLR